MRLGGKRAAVLAVLAVVAVSSLSPQRAEPTAPPAEPAVPAAAIPAPEIDDPEFLSVAPADAANAADPFPFPEGLRGHVDFWTRVFGEWSTRQVALHDMKYPGLVYEVFDLPGELRGTYSTEQQRFVRARREALEERLLRLEVMVDMKVPLTEDEKDLALQIATQAGNDALRGAAQRVRSQRGIRERFRRGLEISGRYDAAFRAIFREAGLPEDLACLPHVESSFQAEARSSAGAVGIWQFTRGAARIFMTLGSAVDERLDPVASARGAARYLKAAHDRLGSWALAVTSYNHGMAGMARARDQFGDDFDRIVREYDGKLFGFASKNFYAEFLAARRIARDVGSYFPEGIAYEPPLALDSVVLTTGMSAQSVAQKYGVPLARLAEINPAWTRRAVRGGRALPAGISVWLPEGTLERIAAAKSRKRPAAPRAAPGPPEPAGSPLADAIVHVVRRGETLMGIAAAHGVRLADLLAANSLHDRAVIHPGQTLRVPGAR